MNSLTGLLLKRRDACLDMVDVLSEQMTRPELVTTILGISEEQLRDTYAFDLLGVELPKEKQEINEDEIEFEREASEESD